MKKILILSNHHLYTYNLRKELIQRLIKENYEVYVTLPYGDKVKLLQEMGCRFIESPLDRRGMNVVRDYKLIISYLKMLKELKPSLVLSYSIKPNIYGGLLCRFLKIPFIPNVTGLGTAVANKSCLQKVLIILYRYSFKNADCVFFQNESNKQFFMSNNILLKKIRVLPGSGININEFAYQKYTEDKETLKFLFIGRIMKDKGIEELVEAAEKLSFTYRNMEFNAIGYYEDGYKKDLSKSGSNVIFHGAKDNVGEYLKVCHALIHPTYHEGMSNVMLEAAATGRPVIASDIPGCREIFDENISGIGFKAGDADSLTKAIQRFIELPHKDKEAMGLAGRNKVEKEFNREIVVDAYLEEIKRILGE